MLFCYFLFGVASSSSTVLRAYIVAVSTTEDRARAYSAIAVANMISVVIGPICQLAFSNLPYPGYELIDDFLKFHIYSAPIWIASATNFISVAIIQYGLRDVHSNERQEDDGAMFTLEGIKKRINIILSLNLAWALIVLCWIERIISNLSSVTLTSIMSPLMMISFGWDGQLTVKILAVCMGLVGVLALSVAAAFFLCKSFISPRVAFLVAVMISVLMYLLTYPYEIVSHKMQPYNVTSGTGCNPEEYTWCDTAYTTWPILLLPIVCAVMGVGVPMAAISLDTIYSKVLGNIDQSMMQGAMIAVEDLIFIVGPIYAASLFTHAGLPLLWLLNGVAVTGGILLWLVFFSKLKRYA
ncbi:Transporter major facilitator family protein [Trichostrongylus colubriformis]|uniref:Transporter major facilitator family protein n=1 Tax=Trichostrongylus colubriformis TaxID=6319 RepID=A0AAN8J2P9_TRICO